MGLVSYECVVTYHHEAQERIPDCVIAQGKAAIKGWLSDNALEDVKDYGDCTAQWVVEIEEA